MKFTKNSEPTHRSTIRRRTSIALVLGLTTAIATGCGFTMRSKDIPFPFKSIMVQGDGEVAKEVRQAMLDYPEVKLVDKTIQGEVVLNIMSERMERNVVAFNSAGRPREVQLRLRVNYRVTDRYAVELSSPREISQTRNVSVTEAETLAITTAEDTMRKDMQRDISEQLVRRLRTIKTFSQ